MTSPEELDEQIDAALKIMQNASVPEGMRARVLRQARQTPRQPHSVRPGWKVAAAVCSLLIVAGVAIRKHNAETEREASSRLLRAESLRTQPPTSKQPLAKPHSLPNTAPQQRLVFATAHARPNVGPTIDKQLGRNDPAYGDMLAPSQPAPEMPLTQQEKLLLAAGRSSESRGIRLRN